MKYFQILRRASSRNNVVTIIKLILVLLSCQQFVYSETNEERVRKINIKEIKYFELQKKWVIFTFLFFFFHFGNSLHKVFKSLRAATTPIHDPSAIWWGKFSQKHNYTYMAKWWCLLAIEKYMFRHIAAIFRFCQLFC